MLTILNEAYKGLSVVVEWEELIHFSKEGCLGGMVYSYDTGKYRFTGRNTFLEFADPVHEKDFYYIQRIDGHTYDVIGVSNNAFMKLISDKYVSGWYDYPGLKKRKGPAKESALSIIMPQISIIEKGFLEKNNPLLYDKISKFSVK